MRRAAAARVRSYCWVAKDQSINQGLALRSTAARPASRVRIGSGP